MSSASRRVWHGTAPDVLRPLQSSRLTCMSSGTSGAGPTRHGHVGIPHPRKHPSQVLLTYQQSSRFQAADVQHLAALLACHPPG
jgi:hypothetical protein